MNRLLIDALASALGAGASRRGMLQGLSGLALAGGIAHHGAADADARKRKRKRKGKKRKKDGNEGGGVECDLEICEGQCVDLDTDPNNCGACGATCNDDVPCVGGRCAVAFGEEGDGVFQFDGPRGLAFDANGFAVLADDNNQRVARFRFAAFQAFGSRGDEDGKFLRPRGVAVNRATGDIYVTDIQRHRIQRFNGNGTFEAAFGSFGTGREQFSFPNGVAIDQVSGNVYVIDTGNDRIKELNAELTVAFDFGLINGPGQFSSPLGIAVDLQRNLVVADTGNNRVVVLATDGGFIRAFGQAGSGNGEFDTPVGVAVDRNGDIFVVDQENSRIQQFSAGGQFRAAFGRAGTGIGEFDAPFGIAFDDTDDAIAVADTGNNRVQFFFPADDNRITAREEPGRSRADRIGKRHSPSSTGRRRT